MWYGCVTNNSLCTNALNRKLKKKKTPFVHGWATLTSIQCLVRYYPDSCLKIIVVSKFDQGQVLHLASLKIYAHLEHIFQYLDGSLQLTICLRVVGHTEIQLRSHSFSRTCPKFESETGILIWNNDSWYVMSSDDILNILICHFLHYMSNLY